MAWGQSGAGQQRDHRAAQTSIVGVHMGSRRTDTALAQQLARRAQQKRLRIPPKPTRTGRPAACTLPAWTQDHSASPTQRAGLAAERQACAYLRSRGITVVAHNLSAPYGEIDLACIDAGVLVFVEVRQRSSARYGGAAASVGHSKRVRLVRTAQHWLPHLVARHFGGKMPTCRFDVITVQPDGMQWLKQAFTLS